MTIFYDFEVNMTESEKEQIYAGNMGNALIQMKELVTRRLSVLKEDIEWQDGYTMICVSSTDKLEIRHYHVTDDLGKKMLACISQRDYDYIAVKVWEAMYPGTIPPTN
jgi:hypothetical protein